MNYSSWDIFSSNNVTTYKNVTPLLQNRLPFNDITSHLNGIQNISNNFSRQGEKKFFNDNFPVENTYIFLKKKSHGMDLNQYDGYTKLKQKEDFSMKEKKNFFEKEKKNSLSIYNNNNNYNFLNEEDDNNQIFNYNNNNNKENIFNNNSNNCINKSNVSSFEDILKLSVDEKKNLDKIERDKKKLLKFKQMKMMSKNRKNSFNNCNNSCYCNYEKKNIFNNNGDRSENDSLFTFGDNKSLEMNLEE